MLGGTNLRKSLKTVGFGNLPADTKSASLGFPGKEFDVARLLDVRPGNLVTAQKKRVIFSVQLVLKMKTTIRRVLPCQPKLPSRR